MSQIGQLLVEAGVITPADLADALAAKQKTNERTLSILISRGVLDPDIAARALSKQLGVPAVMRKHLADRDLRLARLLPAKIAHAHLAVPFATTKDGSVVIAMVEPTNQTSIDAIELALSRKVVVAVAAERMVQALLLEAYGSADESIDIDFDVVTGVKDLAAEPTFQLALLDDSGVARDDSHHKPGFNAQGNALKDALVAQERRTNQDLRQQAEAAAAAAAAATASAAADNLKKQKWSDAKTLTGMVAPSNEPVQPLVNAAVALSELADRDAITNKCFDFLRWHWSAAILFMIKDGMALGQRGFGTNLSQTAVDALAFPMTVPSILKVVAETKMVQKVAPAGTLSDRLAKLMGTLSYVAAPVLIADRVAGVVIVGLPKDKATAMDLGNLALALGKGYERVILGSK